MSNSAQFRRATLLVKVGYERELAKLPTLEEFDSDVEILRGNQNRLELYLARVQRAIIGSRPTLKEYSRTRQTNFKLLLSGKVDNEWERIGEVVDCEIVDGSEIPVGTGSDSKDGSEVETSSDPGLKRGNPVILSNALSQDEIRSITDKYELLRRDKDKYQLKKGALVSDLMKEDLSEEFGRSPSTIGKYVREHIKRTSS